MKRAATIGLAMTLLTLNATLLSSPALAQGLLSDIVRDTFGVVGGVVGGATGLATGVVSGAGNIVTGTVDAAGNVLDATGNVVGRVVVGPTTTTVVPGWTVVQPGSTTTTTTTSVMPGNTSTTTRLYTFGNAQTVFGATLDTRIADLRSAINVAENSGKLTASQAADLRADLERTANAYVTTRSSNALSFEGALSVARDLDAFNNRLATTLNVQPFRTLIVNQNGTNRILVSSSVIPGATTTTTSYPGFAGTINGTGNVLGGVINGVGNFAGGTLGTVIGTAGNLVTGTTGTLLGNAGNMVSGTVTTTGEVIDAYGRVIGTVVPGAMDMATTTTGGSSRMIIGSTTNVLGTNIDLRMADMRRLVSDYTLSGRMNPMQSADMTAMLDRISMNLANARLSGRTLTFDEAIAMARDLDAASSRFGTYIGSNPFNPMVLVQSGSPRMMIITKNGVVSSLPMPGVNSTTTTTTTFGTGVQTSPVAILPILDARRYDLDRLISTALTNRTVTSTEAARLSADLNRIGLDIYTAQNTNGFTMDQAISLARRLDDFSSRAVSSLQTGSLARLTVVGGNGLPVLSSTMFTNVIGLPAVQPTTWVNTFSTRRSDLEAMIASGMSAGQITAQQATDLRAELSRIEAAEAQSRASGLSYVNALPIAMNYDVLGNRIRTYVSSANFVPLIQQNRITFVGGTAAPIDEVSLRRAEISASIDREVFLGRLTATEASRLRVDLSTIVTRENRFRADGVLTYREATQINTDLNRIAARINALIANRRGTVSVAR